MNNMYDVNISAIYLLASSVEPLSICAVYIYVQFACWQLLKYACPPSTTPVSLSLT